MSIFWGDQLSGSKVISVGPGPLEPLTVLLGIVAQVLIGNFGIAGRQAGTTPRKIPPPVQGDSFAHSRRAPCTADPSLEGSL